MLVHFYVRIILLSFVVCHFPDYKPTPPSRIDQMCVLAETCVHDTIPICGKMGEEKRTFLDSCDLLEYACDTNELYFHIDDVKGCPEAKDQ